MFLFFCFVLLCHRRPKSAIFRPPRVKKTISWRSTYVDGRERERNPEEMLLGMPSLQYLKSGRTALGRMALGRMALGRAHGTRPIFFRDGAASGPSCHTPPCYWLRGTAALASPATPTPVSCAETPWYVARLTPGITLVSSPASPTPVSSPADPRYLARLSPVSSPASPTPVIQPG